MSRTITVEEFKAATRGESPDEAQALAWGLVMEALGCPASWEEDLRTALAAEGKAIAWTKVGGAGNN